MTDAEVDEFFSDLEFASPHVRREPDIAEVEAMLRSLTVPEDPPPQHPVQLELALQPAEREPCPPRELSPCDDFDLDEIFGGSWS